MFLLDSYMEKEVWSYIENQSRGRRKKKHFTEESQELL